MHESVDANGTRHRVWQQVAHVLSKLKPDDPPIAIKTDLLCGLFNSNQFAVGADVESALTEWNRVQESLFLPRAAQRTRA